ncbi:MAG: hypothetical protein RMH84_00215, partial [Sulfolobales archaeon]|nr:hypothetical protein [Sulfolobales archaeon]
RTDVAGVRTSVDATKTSVDTLRSEQAKSFDTVRTELSGKIDGAATATYIAVVFALLAFVMSTLAFITIRKVTTAPK